MRHIKFIFASLICAATLGFTSCAPEEKELGPKNDPESLVNVVGTWETGTESMEQGTSSNGNGQVMITKKSTHSFEFTEEYTFTEASEEKVWEDDELVDQSQDLTKGTFIVSSNKIVLSYTKSGVKKSREMSYKRVKMMSLFGIELNYTSDGGKKVSNTFYNMALSE